MSEPDVDEQALFAASVHWEPDPRRFGRFRARFGGRWVFLRLNPAFPDSPLYSLEVGLDETREFDDLPPGWTRGPLTWPDDAEGRPTG